MQAISTHIPQLKEINKESFNNINNAETCRSKGRRRVLKWAYLIAGIISQHAAGQRSIGLHSIPLKHTEILLKLWKINLFTENNEHNGFGQTTSVTLDTKAHARVHLTENVSRLHFTPKWKTRLLRIKEVKPLSKRFLKGLFYRDTSHWAAKTGTFCCSFYTLLS